MSFNVVDKEIYNENTKHLVKQNELETAVEQNCIKDRFKSSDFARYEVICTEQSAKV